MGDKPVKCSSCVVEANVVLEDGSPDKVICPQCGASESYDEVIQSIGNQAAVYAAEFLSASLKRNSKNNKNIRFEGGNIKRLPSKFQVDLS